VDLFIKAFPKASVGVAGGRIQGRLTSTARA
jgi:hypothetical protein